jgi:hypothetical protein
MDATCCQPLRRLWAWIPFPAMTLMVLALYLIREEFPFSNFPMYSNISEEADVTFVTDQNDKPLPMKDLFRTSSGTSKKMYKKELGALTNAAGRDSEQATAQERAQAGKAVLDSLTPRLIRKALPPGTTALRFQLRTFRAGVHPEAGPAPEKLAEHPLPATAPAPAASPAPQP